MASEMRLIDANAIQERLDKLYKKLVANPKDADLAAAVIFVEALIDKAPTVDATPVKRCEYCDHGSHVDTPEGRVWCEKMCRYMVFEGYCSYGERRAVNGN